MKGIECREPVDDLYYGGRSAEYDANVKKLLSRKIFLAWIMKYCVEEFRDMDISDIRDHAIEGEPEVGKTPVMPDFTNGPHLYGKEPERIHGDNTEDRLLTEGTVTFDIRFRAKAPDGESLGLIINVEAQKSSKLSYPLMKRAMYYGSRLLSSQNGVEYQGADYGKIKKVYSIWLCMDMPHGKSGITRYGMKESAESGEIRQEKEYYDLMQVVMVYIGEDRERI